MLLPGVLPKAKFFLMKKIERIYFACRRYRRFVEKGIAQGRRPDLIGGSGAQCRRVVGIESHAASRFIKNAMSES